MIIILTQCFPSRVGGIETLMYNLALHLSRSKDVVVLADQQNFKEDNIFDQNEINFSTKRFRGIKFLRNRKKFNELKKIHVSSKIDAVISDSWKSLEVTIDFLKKNKIPVIEGLEKSSLTRNKWDVFHGLAKFRLSLIHI